MDSIAAGDSLTRLAIFLPRLRLRCRLIITETRLPRVPSGAVGKRCGMMRRTHRTGNTARGGGRLLPTRPRNLSDLDGRTRERSRILMQRDLSGPGLVMTLRDARRSVVDGC